MPKLRKVITLDGPAGGGKSTVAKLLAKRLGIPYLDSGALYRAVTYKLMQAGYKPEDVEKICDAILLFNVECKNQGGVFRIVVDGDDVTDKIRTAQVTAAVSDFAKIPEIRYELMRLQRCFAAGQDLVAEGRDMGTEVFPNAWRKFYLVADPAVRAKRRMQDPDFKGAKRDVKEVEREIRERDEKDSTREIAPLRKAEDAVELDTSTLTAEEVLERIMSRVSERQGGRRRKRGGRRRRGGGHGQGNQGPRERGHGGGSRGAPASHDRGNRRPSGGPQGR